MIVRVERRQFVNTDNIIGFEVCNSADHKNPFIYFQFVDGSSLQIETGEPDTEFFVAKLVSTLIGKEITAHEFRFEKGLR